MYTRNFHCGLILTLWLEERHGWRRYHVLRLKLWRVWIVMDCPYPKSGPECSGKGLGGGILIDGKKRKSVLRKRLGR
jgi:hypothetical protein